MLVQYYCSMTDTLTMANMHMKGTNEKWTKSQKINFREKVVQNVDLVHLSIGAFIS